MQVDSTKVIVEKFEDPIEDPSLAIVGSIVDYSSSIDEDEKKEEDKFRKKEFWPVKFSVKVETPSLPIVIVTPSTPPTQILVVRIVQSNDEAKA